MDGFADKGADSADPGATYQDEQGMSTDEEEIENILDGDPEGLIGGKVC